MPVIPFFLINLTWAHSHTAADVLLGVSRLGVLSRGLYVNAGTERRIESVRDVLSPGILGACALLTVFPLAAKWTLKRFRR